jgi:hypothetical protein
MGRNLSARASIHLTATALLAIAGLSACGGSVGSDGGAPDAASNVIIVGGVSGILSCDDGGGQCGCANVGISFPLARGALDAAATGDGGRDCAGLCPDMGDPWFSCEPAEGSAYVRCKPECL